MPVKITDGASHRTLPKKQNPLLEASAVSSVADLVKSRRLGRTNLAVQPSQVGSTSATQPENLGPFDYAHLRVSLPADLKGSQVFAPTQGQVTPQSYFLMRRSRDGAVSATGMFKAAFPWASHAEEQAEKDHIKNLSTSAPDEIAGNLWIKESLALELAEEYGIVPFVEALLDESPIQVVTDDSKDHPIASPPRFTFTAGDKLHSKLTNGTPARGARAATPKARGRPRAASPEKKSGSPVKSTKKPRATKAQKEAIAASAKEASEVLQGNLNDAASAINGEATEQEQAKIEIEKVVETVGDTTTETTNVKFELPKGAPELPLPESPEQMLERAKEMVDEANRIEGGAAGSSRSKRKLEDVDEELEASDQLPSKRTRLLEQQALRRETIRKRAVLGVAATFLVGASLTYLTG